jgi:peptidyl-prolyl cis-trans isomerase B (cyclophilin B)
MNKLISCCMLAALVTVSSPTRAQTEAAVEDVKVVIKTDRGDIECLIYASKVPNTAANFLNLAKRGYYDGLTFHRVIPNFMIQGGDPTASGSGGPGYKFKDETMRELKHNAAGILSMANSDRNKQPYSNTGNTNGSQFFITHGPTDWLDGLHTVFGRVTKGQDVVDAVRQGDKIKGIEIQGDVDPLFESTKEQLAQWNKILDSNKK